MKELPIKVRDIEYLPRGEKIVITFDGNQPSTTDADGLLDVYLGRVAANHKLLPISYSSWPKVMDTYKNNVWDDIIKVLKEFISCFSYLLYFNTIIMY